MAEKRPGDLRALCERRAFTRLGQGLATGRGMPADALACTAAAVAEQSREAFRLGAGPDCIAVVATAAVRRAANAGDLATAVRAACGLDVTVLTADQEARLAFSGATCALDPATDGEVAVADVGGGSTELAVGAVGAPPRWSTSFPVGSGLLADTYLHDDPPGPGELAAARGAAEAAFDELRVDRPALALAVGGSATSVARLVGRSIGRGEAERAIQLVSARPAAVVAADHGLAIERVRLLPAGLMLLSALSDRLGRPLEVARGGLREGVVLELARAGGREGLGA